jgi:N-acetylglucosaminyldiphosphoundecaprenol N-acetyl-beta-D-mannosaminyltransferase
MRVEFLNTPVDVLTLEETVNRAVVAMRNRCTCQHVALNVAKLVKMRRDPELWRDVTESDIVGIDGVGIVWGARILGIRVKERVAGIDLFERLLEVCAREGFRPYFLGAREDVLDRAISRLRLRLPTLHIAGSRNGYFSSEEEKEVIQAIRESDADCLFVAMPTPRKERLLAKFRGDLGVAFIMGIGGSIDVIAGVVKRAPPAVQALGLEWLYRLAQEPRRMFWRYISTNTIFAVLLARAWLDKKLSLFSCKA